MARTRIDRFRLLPLIASGFLAGSVAISASASQPPEADEAVDLLRVYDVRDLMLLEPSGSILTLSPQLVSAEDESPFIEISPRIERLREKDILLEISGATGLAATRLRDGIYVVTGSPGSHEQLQNALNSYRGVSAKRYIVSVEAMQVTSPASGTEAPAPGSPAPGKDGVVLLRTLQVVKAQTESPIQATSTEQYISGWVPVVGTQSVGYQAQHGSAEDGFAGALIVGSQDEPNSPVTIQLSGVLMDSHITTVPITLSGDQLPLSTVRRSERTVRSAVKAPPGVPVVLAVVNGFEPETTIILTASAVLAPDE